MSFAAPFAVVRINSNSNLPARAWGFLWLSFGCCLGSLPLQLHTEASNPSCGEFCAFVLVAGISGFLSFPPQERLCLIAIKAAAHPPLLDRLPARAHQPHRPSLLSIGVLSWEETLAHQHLMPANKWNDMSRKPKQAFWQRLFVRRELRQVPRCQATGLLLVDLQLHV